MAVVGYATVQLIPSMDGFTSKVKEQLGTVNESISASTSSASEQAGSDAGNHFSGGFLKTAGSFLTAQLGYELFSGLQQGITQTITAGFSDASFLQSASKSLIVLTGSAKTAQSEMAALYGFAERTPFSAQNVVKYAQQLLGAGANAKSIVPDLQDMGDAVSAVGGSESDMTDAMLGFTQMMTRGKLDLQDLRQISNSGIPVFTELAKALHKPASGIQDLISYGNLASNVALPKLLSQMEKDYGGSMVAQSKTLTGAWSNVVDTINQSLGVAFTPLANWLATKLPAVASIAGNAINGISKFFKDAQGAAKSFSDVFANIFGDPFLKGLLGGTTKPKPITLSTKEASAPPSFLAPSAPPADIAKPITEAAKAPSFLSGNGFSSGVEKHPVVPAQAKTPPSFLNVLNPRPSFIPTAPTPPDLTPPKTPAAPKGSSPSDIAQTVTNLQKSSTAWGSFVADYSSGLRKVWAAFGSWLAPLISTALPQLAKLMTSVLPPAIGALDGAWNTMVILFTQLAPVVKDIVVPAVKALLSLWNGTFEVFKGAFGFLQGFFDLIDGWATGNSKQVSKGFSELKTGVLDMSNGITKALLALLKYLTVDMVRSLTQAAVDMLGGFNKGWGKAIVGFADHLTQPFKDAITSIKKFLGIQSPSKVFIQIASDTVQGFLNGWASRVGSIVSSVGALGGRVVSAVGNAGVWLVSKGRDVLSGMLSGIESGWGGVASFVGGIGGRILGDIGYLGGMLEGAGESIMGGFLSGLEAGYSKVQSLVGGVAGWIKDHKGPLSYDKVLLTPAGQAVMDGLRSGIESQMPALGGTLAAVTRKIAGVNVGATSASANSTREAVGGTTVNQTFVTNNPVAKDPMQSIRTSAQTARAHMNLSFA
ncbi:tape measure protein [Gryllotalpicola reticulitermitis]|uniref:Tape measure protein n=1 Tax=Gryllotalpicola reticulitermitis TaxID=1184153 RepID=A0ABV8Q9P9_9MICO